MIKVRRDKLRIFRFFRLMIYFQAMPNIILIIAVNFLPE
jgi:hypothetical protein